VCHENYLRKRRVVNAPFAHKPSKLGRRVDRELDADRQYFERHPDRRHRIRRVFAAERAEFEFHGGELRPAASQSVYVVVEQVRVGARLRTPFIASSDIDPDELDEAVCAAVFAYVLPSHMRAMREWLLEIAP
jgi:hypothetical protein